jgi:hypothetical protein
MHSQPRRLLNARRRKMLYLAIDPGETTGWCRFQDETPIEFGEVNPKEAFYEWLFGQNPSDYNYEHIVAEQYIIRPPKAGGFDHQWGKVPTLRVLGAVEAFATVRHIPMSYQNSDILLVACQRFGLPHPKNRSLPQRNAISAMAHGRWWWFREGAQLMSRH